jgi:hypothetical protein
MTTVERIGRRRTSARRERERYPRRARELFADAGYGADDRGLQLSRHLLEGRSMAGGATGAGPVSFLSNLPPDRFVMNPALFQQSTERQDIPQPSQTFNGFGTSTSLRLQSVGVLALVRVYFSGSLVVGGTGAVTSLPGWPYGLARRVAFNANGQTSLISCSGITLRARQRRLFRNPAESLQSAPGIPPGVIANGTYAVTFMLDIPIAHDFFTGVGWVLAQNPSTSLSLDISWAAQSDYLSIASGGTATLTGTIYPMISTFAVGQAQVGDKQATVVPDLTVFHGLIDNRFPFASSGIVQAPLIRTAGQLVNYAFNISNGGSAEIAPGALTEIQFRYGGNRQPRVYNPPQMLVEKNQADYNGVVTINGLTHTFLDFEVDNPIRDIFIPEALVELQSQFTIPSSVTVNAGAYVGYIEESLYPAV